MKEFVLVEFIFDMSEHTAELNSLLSLGDDFILLSDDHSEERIRISANGSLGLPVYKITGKINSQTAAIIKLQNPTLAGKMRISYISDELKDRYRK